MPFDANGELRLSGVPRDADHGRTAREVAELLQLHADMGYSRPVELMAFEAKAVLNVLVGIEPPVARDVYVGPRQVVDHRDEWEKGPR